MNSDVLIAEDGFCRNFVRKNVSGLGIDFLLVEASEDVGGRMRTDHVNGFFLDRGFQVFSRVYPKGEKWVEVDTTNPKIPGWDNPNGVPAIGPAEIKVVT